MAGEAEGRELTLHAHASRLTLHAYSCKGPERIFNGAAAMKPWKTSSAMNEPRNARLSFRIYRYWSGYGTILPPGTSRKPAGPREAAMRFFETPRLISTSLFLITCRACW